ncbi:MAG: CopG family transcriptional regulator [Spirochaetaceae bacterium]|nr:MAG: CopG family transcriptional regulator [Spirochaetaceae bacterium]
MSKTITIRLDDETYEMIKSAAAGQMRTISNFMEYAAVSYLTEEAFVSNEEMDQIMSDSELVQTLKKAKSNVQSKRYSVVE